jgi:hypothetical protein
MYEAGHVSSDIGDGSGIADSSPSDASHPHDSPKRKAYTASTTA